MADQPGLRGIALVDAVIAHVESGKSKLPITRLRPASPEALARATLPASVARWLAYDTSWAMRVLGWGRAKDALLPTRTLRDLVTTELATPLVDELGELERTWLPEPCAPLRVGSESLELLYLGAADAYGEHPVVAIDVDDCALAELVLPGFDVFLACESGLSTRKRAASVYAHALAEQAHLVFEGTLAREKLGTRWKGRAVPRPAALPPPETFVAPASPKKRKGPLLPGEPPRTATQVTELLGEAAELGEASELPPLLALAAKLTPGGEHLHPLLRTACRFGQLELVRAVMDLGLTPDTPLDAASWRGLHFAAINGHAAIVRLLLERGADPNVLTEHRQSAVELAANEQHGEVVDALVAGGARLDPAILVSSAIRARADHPPRGVEALLAAGMDPNVGCHLGLPLHFAAEAGSLPAVRALVERGADVDAVGVAGFAPTERTPLRVAFDAMRTPKREDYAAIVRYLVAKGADVARAGLAGLVLADGSVCPERVHRLTPGDAPALVRVEATLVGLANDRAVVKGMQKLVRALGASIVTPPEYEVGMLYAWVLRVPAVTPGLAEQITVALIAATADVKPLVRIEIVDAS